MTTILQHCLTGISLGGAYALIAIGYTLVYGILRLINFAHGDIFMMAGYFMIFSLASFPWPVAIVITLVVTTAMGIAIERMAYKPLRSSPRMSIMNQRHRRLLSLAEPLDVLFTAIPRVSGDSHSQENLPNGRAFSLLRHHPYPGAHHHPGRHPDGTGQQDQNRYGHAGGEQGL
jgi:ABC-type branched-subunit amino acid transport system permease subunit